MRLATGIVLAIAALTAGCGTKMINIRYMRPPQRNIPESVRKVGIVVTDAQGAQLADKAASDRILSLLENAIITNGHYALIARQELGHLLAEHHLNMADFSAGNSQGLKIEGVDALIISVVGQAAVEENVGPITILVEEMKRDKVQKTRKKQDGTTETYWDLGPPYKVYIPTELRHGRYVFAEFGVTFKMIDTRKGYVYASLPYRADWDSRSQVHHQGLNYAIPPNQLPDPRTKLAELMQGSITPFMQQVAPYEVQRSVALYSGSELTKKGIEMASRGLVPEAMELFLQATTMEDPPDLALYDYGVMLEILGNYAEALQYYKKAYAVSDRNAYLEAMQRVSEEMKIAGQ